MKTPQDNKRSWCFLKQKRYPMTEIGKQALEKELGELQTLKRKEALERIKTARKFCDFREDSEYDAAMDSQAQNEERIVLLQSMLEHAEIISGNEHAENTVAFGIPFTFIELPDGDQETYTIVGTAEANPLHETISNESPLAKGLLGRSIGDEVTVKIPSGDMLLKIMSIG